MRWRVRSTIVVVCLAVMAGCATPSADRLYQDAIVKSAVKRPGDAAPLEPILTDPVKAVSWSRHWPRYAEQPFGSPLHGETWITTDTQLKARCAAFPRDKLVRRIEQLLGLPPGAGENRRIVTFEVTRDQVFRPCVDPSVSTRACPALVPEAPGAMGLTDAHLAWLAGHMMYSYRIGPERDQTGFPFTGFGYTFDWSPDSPDNVGLSEYVVRKGAVISNVRVTTTEEFCTR